MICAAVLISAAEVLMSKLKIEAKTCVLLLESPTLSELPDAVVTVALPAVVTRPRVEGVRVIAASAWEAIKRRAQQMPVRLDRVSGVIGKSVFSNK